MPSLGVDTFTLRIVMLGLFNDAASTAKVISVRKYD
jgi:hypothetical protein